MNYTLYNYKPPRNDEHKYVQRFAKWLFLRARACFVRLWNWMRESND